jgi:citrate lyase beta subunit
MPWLDLDDAEGCRAETARVAALGYTAKSLIHPAQVAPVHAGLAPTPQALAQAQRVVDACAHEAGAQRLDGRLVDRPVLLAAQRLLRRSQT